MRLSLFTLPVTLRATRNALSALWRAAYRPARAVPMKMLSSSLLLAFVTLSGAARADDVPDAWITTKVRSTLLTADGLSSSQIHIDTIDGRVTLFGSVPTEPQRANAEALARKVNGAKSVRNLLQVVSASDKTSVKAADDVIRKEVEAILKNEVALRDSRITVRSVNNGVVLLGGTAKTLSDHIHALGQAGRVTGVRQVASEIKSPNTLADAEIWREGMYDGKEAARATSADMWITSAVKLRLLANTQTPGFDINVDTMRGVVTLFGIVDSEQAKRAAADEARKVDGTTSVRNELQVVAPSAQSTVAENDNDVRKAIERRLGASSSLSDAKINLEVKNGIVRLTGTVSSYVDRLTALTLVRTTKGVRGVNDELKLTKTSVTAR